MNTDFRVSVDFFTHHKARKLRKRLGAAALLSLLQLWAYAAKVRTDGDLSGMSSEDVELAAEWEGEDGIFCAALLEVGFLDQGETGLLLHDWEENNDWAAKAIDRQDKARFSRLATVNRREFERLKASGVNAISKTDYDRLTNAKRPADDRLTNANGAPTPSPSPSPSPKPKGKEKDIKTPCQVFAEDSDAYRLAAFMLETLKANLPTLKEPNLQKWASDFDVAIRNDPRMKDIRFVAQVIKWACSDDFWKANIQCPGKLRDKFDQLTAKMEATRTARASPSARLGPSRNGNTFPDGRERDYGESDFGALGGTP